MILSNYVEGIGMRPAPTIKHKDKENDFQFNIYNIINRTKYRVYQEAALYGDCNELIPDISVVKRKTFEPILLIEITTHIMLDKIKDKMIEIRNRIGECELFVYDYDTEKWYNMNYDGEDGEEQTCKEHLYCKLISHQINYINKENY